MSANTPTVEGTSRGTLLVVDGHSLAFRAFFALPVENFSTSSGQATNAVWGFATMLSQVIDAEHPDHLAVAFDVKGGTFRNQMLPQYKGTRDAAPEELLSQLPLIQQMLTALGVTYIEKPGYEGDDVIGTLASMGDQAGYRTLVLSGDRDAFQLINDNITVLYPGHHFKDLKHMTPDAVQEKYRVSPAQYPDLAALRGETADNIPGVPGVGDGFAAKWINQYGGLEQIIEHADEISGKKGEALRENIEQVKLNRSVNALVRDLDLGVSVSDLTFGQVDAGQLDDLFTKLEFGVRTKNRVLKTFNADKPSGDVHESSKLGLPHVEDVNDPHVVETWVQNHFPVVQEHLHERHERSSNDIPEFGFEIDSSTRCTDKVKQSWTLYAEGTSKPGEASLSALMIAVHGDHQCRKRGFSGFARAFGVKRPGLFHLVRAAGRRIDFEAEFRNVVGGAFMAFVQMFLHHGEMVLDPCLHHMRIVDVFDMWQPELAGFVHVPGWFVRIERFEHAILGPNTEFELGE